MNSFFTKIAAVAFPILIGCINLSSAQAPASKNSNPISGVVVNSKSNEPVEFATITIKGASVGTVANDKGLFCFEASKSIGATLLVNCMGYEPLELKISESIYAKPNTFKLNPAEYAIQEVTVKTKKIKAKDVVKMAVKRIPQNYFTKQQKSYTFERTISRDTIQKGFIMEELTLRTPQINSADHREAWTSRRKFIYKNNSESSWKNIDTTFNGWGSFNVFENSNAFFKNKKFGKWHFSFVPSPSDTIIAISFKQKWRPMEYQHFNGTMLINRKDLAIVRIHYDYALSVFSRSHSSVLYKKQNGQYALFYMVTDDYGINPFPENEFGMPQGIYTINYERFCIDIISDDADAERLVKVITNLKKHPNEWNIPNLPIVSLEQN